MIKKINGLLFVFLGLAVLISACAPTHRVVRVKSIKEADGSVRSSYGVTYNNTLIPEYTKTAKGAYALSYDGAWDLYEKRADDINSWIGDKYYLTNSTWFAFSNFISRASLLAIAPLVVPVEWVGERLFPEPDLGEARSLGELTRDLVELQYDQPRPKAAPLEDSK